VNDTSVPRFTILGAGPVGTLMALLLAGDGQQVRLLERRMDPRVSQPARGRSINLALAARGIAALEQAGLWQHIAAQSVVMRGRMLHDEDGQLEFLRYGVREEEVLQAVSRESLNRMLIEAAAEHRGITLEFQVRCLDVDPLSRTLTLRDERTGEARAERFEHLLGTDGAGSAVRHALLARGFTNASEEPLLHDYRELHLPATADGFAFEPHALHIWPRGEYMLIALPNRDQSFTATLFLPHQGQPSFESLGRSAAVQELFTRQFPDVAERVADLTMQFHRHPQGHLATLHCEGWQAAGRVLLLGDAAHAIVPFHGQGLNCGFEDCLALRAGLARHGSPAEAFAQFEQQRRPDTEAMAEMALENYLEMRSSVRAPEFATRKAVAAELEQHFPQRFIPRYSMVMFHPEIPYGEAQRRGLLQERVLDALSSAQIRVPLDAAAVSRAERLLDEAGL
jgi:kynurenine 3-monooxygenase